MKKLLTTALILALPVLASADRYNNNIDYGQVIEVEPIYQTVSIPEERQVCDRRRDDNYRNQRNNNVGSTVLGGIIGGAIGNRFGRGHGRDASTALGILVGAGIGSQKGNNQPRRNTCYIETYYVSEDRMMGYDVTYRYKGEIYQTQMQNHPGDRVRLRVDVDVIE